MANIKLTYTEQDESQVKKTFDILTVWFEMDVVQVLDAMNQNHIAVENSEAWISQLDEKVQVVQDWRPGEDVKIGNLRRYNDITYVVIQAHTTQENWPPDTVPALFLARPEPDPGETYSPWVQPAGAHDAYQTGDRVNHNSSDWESTVDNNVWEPGVYGWNEI